jgi:hypothetical protein
MSQRQQLERIFEIDRQISAGEFPNAERLARSLEVSRRVIFKDREFMIYRLGAPIEFESLPPREAWIETEDGRPHTHSGCRRVAPTEAAFRPGHQHAEPSPKWIRIIAPRTMRKETGLSFLDLGLHSAQYQGSLFEGRGCF